jgi:pyruvate dehydrogenase E1 component beta subunit
MLFSEAIRTALELEMQRDERLIIIGQGVRSPFYVGNSMKDLDKLFGPHRIIDSPVSENGVTGMALGYSLKKKPIVVIHPRMDFMILAMDSIVNAAAKWRYSLNWSDPIPLTIRTMINRGGEQGAQHSQALHGWLGNIPGLRVVMPSQPKDAFELLIQSIQCPDPTVYIEDRWSYDLNEEFDLNNNLPPLEDEGPRKISSGKELTVVGIGHSTNIVRDALQFCSQPEDVEIYDLRIIRPLKLETIFDSLRVTKRLLVVDAAWKQSSTASEIICQVAENENIHLRSKPRRINLPDCPAPTSSSLEGRYYFSSNYVAKIIDEIIED